MKTFGKMSFGMGVVNLAKRGVTAEPELILNGTVGNFRMTQPVTRALGIAAGEYVMFISNISSIDTAIAQKDEELVAWCKENKVDITSAEGIARIHAEFDQWGIAKGIQEFDAKGNPIKTTERWTKSDKIEYVKGRFSELLEEAKATASEEFVAALTAEGMTEEAQIEMIADSLQPEEIDKYRGSKCANASNLKGIGNILNFADASVWAALKANMGETAKTHNRIYSVDITDMQEVSINDGHKDVVVKVALLKEYRDVESSRAKKAAEGENVDDTDSNVENTNAETAK